MDISDPKEMNFDEKELREIEAACGPGCKLLGPNDTFEFTCSRCTHCCKNRSDYHRFNKMILVPYDIIRISRRLKMTTTEFLSRYTEFEARPRTQSMEVALKFEGDEYNNKCPFLESDQCNIYDDRPMGCRLYPLGRVFEVNKYAILLPDSHNDCALGTGQKWIVRDWLESMDLFHYFKYDRPRELFNRIDRDKFNKLPSKERDTFFRCLYDIDSIVTIKNKGKTAMSAEELISTIYKISEEILESHGCLKPKDKNNGGD